MAHGCLSLRRATVVAVIFIWLCSGACLAQAQGQTPAAVWGQALKSYQQGRWSGAYGRFAYLADMGDPDSARIALFMLRYGPRLYGTPWSASPTQIEEWSWAAGKQLSPLVSEAGD